MMQQGFFDYKNVADFDRLSHRWFRQTKTTAHPSQSLIGMHKLFCCTGFLCRTFGHQNDDTY